LPEFHSLFDTEFGTCGLGWNARGLTRVQLPEADRSATERRLQAGRAHSHPTEPPPPIRKVTAMLQSYFAGARIDFSPIALDLGGVGSFYRKVYEAARSIGWGQTTSYGELARQAGYPNGARAVGQALGRNPVPIIVPCHRVLASGGKAGGFSAFGGARTKMRLLALEGLRLGHDAPLLPGLLPARH
jgi:methylated-DNA-[protein]-cysteine S-methyltransferase